MTDAMRTADLAPGDRVPMSWDDYQALGEDVPGEYIDGELVVSPSATGTHQDIVHDLVTALKAVLPASVRARHEWAWKPGRDEFIPDVIVFDHTDEQARYTGTPHLVVEVLSTEPARDLLRKYAKYAEAGLRRYWVVDPDGPEIIVYELAGGGYVETARYAGSDPVSLDIGPATVSLVPAQLGAAE